MKNIRTRLALLSLVLLSLLLAPGVRPGLANVELVYFLVEPEGGSIFLEWETGSELDTASFIIERRSPENAAPVQIETVEATGELDGSTYTAADDSVTLGTTYWYDLYELTTSQAKVLLDSQSITAGQQVETTTTTAAAASATTPPAATNSPTNAAPGAAITPSPTLSGAYPGPGAPVFTPTVTRTPFQSFVPGQVSTPTAALSETPFGGENFALEFPAEPVTATITLAPLPTIELIFPTPLARAGSPPLESAAMLYDAEGELVEPEEAAPPPSRLLLIGLVVLLWVGLGAWFVVLFRRMN